MADTENNRFFYPDRSTPSPFASGHHQGPQHEEKEEDNTKRRYELGDIVGQPLNLLRRDTSNECIAAPLFVLPSKRRSLSAKALAVISPVNICDQFWRQNADIQRGNG